MRNIIETEVFNKLFSSIAEEIGIVLRRSAFSSNIKERCDFSCAIFDYKGELAAQAAHIPVHLGAMPLTLKAAIDHFSLLPGDVIITNDPFQGGSHLPDITLIEGLHDESGNILFYVVNRAHHADVGGRIPGSMGFSRSLAEEGVLIPPTLLYKRGRLNREFFADFLGSVRNPAERRGDIQAQRASLRRGRQRIKELLAKYGSRHVFTILDELKNYGEEVMSSTIGQLPDGTCRFTDYLDNDGLSRRPLPISVELTISGSRALADFSRTAPQVGSPLNTVRAVTVSAVIYVFQCLAGEGYPINQGSYRPITVKTRPGTLLDARNPAPVAAGNVETSQRIVDVLFGALALFFGLCRLFTGHTRLWRRFTAVACVLALVTALSAGYDTYRYEWIRHGVVTSKELVARKGNGESYPPAFTEPLREGREFRVLEERERWILIRLRDGVEGWVPTNGVELY